MYESAKLDGAGVLRRIWYITIPMLRPTTLFLLVIGIIGSLQVFTQIFVMTSGGPVNKTTTMVYYMYLWAFKYFDMGYASTLAFALFLMLLVVHRAPAAPVPELGHGMSVTEEPTAHRFTAEVEPVMPRRLRRRKSKRPPGAPKEREHVSLKAKLVDVPGPGADRDPVRGAVRLADQRVVPADRRRSSPARPRGSPTTRHSTATRGS